MPRILAPWRRTIKYTGAMLRADDVIRMFQLAPLPTEGGYFRETHRSRESTAIYYLLTPETRSHMHRLSSEEVYHFYLGDAVEQIVIPEGGRAEIITLGSDVASGARVQRVVPARAWQGSR
jgi:predicted cupin superfamily sugar epimerase